MRLVRFPTRPAQISPDIRAALTSLGRGDDRVGGVGLIGAQPPGMNTPVDAVIVTAHGVVVVVGVDLPDPAIRLEAPLRGVWKADGWPLTREEAESGSNASNPSEEALAVSGQVHERVRTTAGHADMVAGTVIAVGPFVEHVEQPAGELAGPVRIVYPTSTSLLASIVSLSSAARPFTVEQARAVITALSPDTQFTDDVLAGEGFVAGDGNTATEAAAPGVATPGVAAPDAATPGAAASGTTAPETGAGANSTSTTAGVTTAPHPDTAPSPPTSGPVVTTPEVAATAVDTTEQAPRTEAAPPAETAHPLTEDADTETLDPEPHPGSADSAVTSPVGPTTRTAAAAVKPEAAVPSAAATPSTAPRTAAPGTAGAGNTGPGSVPMTASTSHTAGTPPALPARPAAAEQVTGTPTADTQRASAGTTPPGAWAGAGTGGSAHSPPSASSQAPRSSAQAGWPGAARASRTGAGLPQYGAEAAAPASGAHPDAAARPARWRRLSAQTWRWIAAGAAFVSALVVIITFTAMSGGDEKSGPARMHAGGLEFTQRAAQITEKCAAHAVGDLKVTLADGGCTELRRGSFATTVRGTDVVVSVAALTFTDRQAAQRFLEVADTPGTGTIRDLATASQRWARPMPDWSGAAYVSDLEGATVRLVLASPRDRASTDEPEVADAAEAALGLVKLND